MINKTDLEQGFERADVPLRIVEMSQSSALRGTASIRYNVRQARDGEYIEISCTESAPQLQVIDTNKKHRHVLLRNTETGNKFLLGHDESHLFVSQVTSTARTIEDALVRLAPAELQEALKNQKKGKARIWDRATKRYVRQGEWFFLPVKNNELIVDESKVIHDEPLQRDARSKAHICEDMYRTGGKALFIVQHQTRDKMGHPLYETLTLDTADWEGLHGNSSYKLIREAMTDAIVYVRGAISHPDHKTIHLKGWHRVFINSEILIDRSVSGFLD